MAAAEFRTASVEARHSTLDVADLNSVTQLQPQLRQLRSDVQQSAQPGTVRWLLPVIDTRGAALRAVRSPHAQVPAHRVMAYWPAIRAAAVRSLAAGPNGSAANDQGWMTLDRAAPEIDRQWTDTGDRRAERHLKHRAVGDTRRVPVPQNSSSCSGAISPRTASRPTACSFAARPVPSPRRPPTADSGTVRADKSSPLRSTRAPLPDGPMTYGTPPSRPGSAPGCPQPRSLTGPATVLTSCSGSTPSASTGRKPSHWPASNRDCSASKISEPPKPRRAAQPQTLGRIRGGHPYTAASSR